MADGAAEVPADAPPAEREVVADEDVDVDSDRGRCCACLRLRLHTYWGQSAEQADAFDDPASPFNAVKLGEAKRLWAMIDAEEAAGRPWWLLRGGAGETLYLAALLFNSPVHYPLAYELVRRRPELLWSSYESGSGKQRSAYHGECALHLVIANNRIDELRWILDREEELRLERVRPDDPESPLRYPRTKGMGYEPLVGRIADGSFFAGARYYGGTPLNLAVSLNAADMVIELLLRRAHMVKCDGLGNTAAHMAVYHNRIAMLDLLLELWARDVGRPVRFRGFPLTYICNKAEMTPIAYAASLSRTRAYAWLLEREKVFFWRWGPIECFLYPLHHVDPIAARLAALPVAQGSGDGGAATLTAASDASPPAASSGTPANAASPHSGADGRRESVVPASGVAAGAAAAPAASDAGAPATAAAATGVVHEGRFHGRGWAAAARALVEHRLPVPAIGGAGAGAGAGAGVGSAETSLGVNSSVGAGGSSTRRLGSATFHATRAAIAATVISPTAAITSSTSGARRGSLAPALPVAPPVEHVMVVDAEDELEAPLISPAASVAATTAVAPITMPSAPPTLNRGISQLAFRSTVPRPPLHPSVALPNHSSLASPLRFASTDPSLSLGRQSTAAAAIAGGDQTGPHPHALPFGFPPSMSRPARPLLPAHIAAVAVPLLPSASPGEVAMHRLAAVATAQQEGAAAAAGGGSPRSRSRSRSAASTPARDGNADAPRRDSLAAAASRGASPASRSTQSATTPTRASPILSPAPSRPHRSTSPAALAHDVRAAAAGTAAALDGTGAPRRSPPALSPPPLPSPLDGAFPLAPSGDDGQVADDGDSDTVRTGSPPSTSPPRTSPPSAIPSPPTLASPVAVHSTGAAAVPEAAVRTGSLGATGIRNSTVSTTASTGTSSSSTTTTYNSDRDESGGSSGGVAGVGPRVAVRPPPAPPRPVVLRADALGSGFSVPAGAHARMEPLPATGTQAQVALSPTVTASSGGALATSPSHAPTAAALARTPPSGSRPRPALHLPPSALTMARLPDPPPLVIAATAAPVPAAPPAAAAVAAATAAPSTAAPPSGITAAPVAAAASANARSFGGGDAATPVHRGQRSSGMGAQLKRAQSDGAAPAAASGLLTPAQHASAVHKGNSASDGMPAVVSGSGGGAGAGAGMVTPAHRPSTGTGTKPGSDSAHESRGVAASGRGSAGAGTGDRLRGRLDTRQSYGGLATISHSLIHDGGAIRVGDDDDEGLSETGHGPVLMRSPPPMLAAHTHSPAAAAAAAVWFTQRQGHTQTTPGGDGSSGGDGANTAATAAAPSGTSPTSPQGGAGVSPKTSGDGSGSAGAGGGAASDGSGDGAWLWRTPNLLSIVRQAAMMASSLNAAESKSAVNVPSPRTALEAAVDGECFGILLQPVMMQLLERKWRHYARLIFTLRLIVHLAFLVTFTAMSMLRFAMPNDRRVFTRPSVYAGTAVDARLAVATFATEAAVMAFIVLRGLLDLRRTLTLGVYKTFIGARGSAFADRWLSTLTIIATILAFALDAGCGAECSRVPFSIGSALGWASLLIYLVGWRRTGPFVITLYTVVTVDLVRWGFLFLVVLFGFAQAILFVADTDTLGQYEGRFALGMITRQLIDVFFQPQLADSANDRYFLLPVLIFGFLGSVLLTNLLIATLSETFARISSASEARWQLERARIILSTEADMPTWLLRQPCVRYWNVNRGTGKAMLPLETHDRSQCTSRERVAVLRQAFTELRIPRSLRSLEDEGSFEADARKRRDELHDLLVELGIARRGGRRDSDLPPAAEFAPVADAGTAPPSDSVVPPPGATAATAVSLSRTPSASSARARTATAAASAASTPSRRQLVAASMESSRPRVESATGIAVGRDSVSSVHEGLAGGNGGGGSSLASPAPAAAHAAIVTGQLAMTSRDALPTVQEGPESDGVA